MAEQRQSEDIEVEIETVAEVQAVNRETVKFNYHADLDAIQILQTTHWGDVQSISFPASKAAVVANAILEMARQGQSG